MPKTKSRRGQTCPDAFRIAPESLDVLGRWHWDASTDRVRVDGFGALLFRVDPLEAEAGIPLDAYGATIHADDRDRVMGLIRRSAEEGSAYLAEYRVTGVDGRTRWMLARGRFVGDHVGRPLSGRGILVDITSLRAREDRFEGAEHAAAGESPLDRAAEHAIAAQAAIVELRDPTLKARADALLMGLGRKLAQREIRQRRRRLN